MFYDVPLPEENMTLTAIEFTPLLNAPYNCSLILVGTSKGEIMVINADTFEFIHNVNMFDAEIGFIRATKNSILIGNEIGDFINSPIIDGPNLLF